MFDFATSAVPVRDDLVYAYRSLWHHVAAPGPTMTGEQRVGLLEATRAGRAATAGGEIGIDDAVGALSDALYHRPTDVDAEMVGRATDAAGDARTVEAVALVAMLAAVDGTHRALGADPEPLPAPMPGAPTGRVRDGLKRRRTHIPVPPGPIPVVLDLLPPEGAAFRSLFGPQYMTDAEMALDGFSRSPGLDRAQMELVSSRTSLVNECFY